MKAECRPILSNASNPQMVTRFSAMSLIFVGVPNGIRTRITAVKGIRRDVNN